MIYFLSLFKLGFLPKGGGMLGAIFGILFGKYIPFAWILNIILCSVGTYFVHKLQLQDPKWVILDEVCGGLLIYAMTKPQTMLGFFLIIILFGLLDTFKPFPIYFFDRKDHAFFVFLDDYIASIVGAGLFFIFEFFLKRSL
jgi:phosphatidylglycerophosphatase A